MRSRRVEYDLRFGCKSCHLTETLLGIRQNGISSIVFRLGKASYRGIHSGDEPPCLAPEVDPVITP